MEQQHNFPNGFTSWHETHFEIVSALCMLPDDDTTPFAFRLRMGGAGELYETAQEWTDEFEYLNQGRAWDGDFFDEVTAFINIKLNGDEM
jgi:hypothetical protein